MKRYINIFLHKIRVLRRNKKLTYKIRFSVLSIILLTIISVGVFSLLKSFSSYNSTANLSLDIQTAVYVIDEGEMDFNIDLDQIIPSDDSYIYTFSISNYDDDGKRTDVDLEYTLSIQTTTNLPLDYRLYYDSCDLDTDGIISNQLITQDSDGSWYKYLTVDDVYEFSFEENQTNIYYLVVDFPTTYKSVLEYSDALENILVIIKSKQIV